MDDSLDVMRTRAQELARRYPPVQQRQSTTDPFASKYHELLMAVATKVPGESRHQTALRYIREAENRTVTAREGAKSNV